MRGWIEWFSRGLWKRRRPILGWTAFFTILIGVAVARTYDWAGRPERTINDPAFARAAVRVCEAEIPKLRAVRREGDTEDDLEQETADQVDDVAAKLETMVTRLRDLPVRPPDQPEVDAWFVAYGDFIEAGRNYARALRQGDEDLYNRVDDEGVEPLEQISEFARANRIDACIP